MASLLVPVVYGVVVISSLLIFSTIYRRRVAGKNYEPYFPSHPERNTYVTLLQRTDPPTPDATLKAALVRRAMADVQRVVRIREDKPAMQNLLQKGSIGDDLWNSLLDAERELEAEIMEVVGEANSFVEGWGTLIFQTANEMIANEKMRAQFESAQARRDQNQLLYGKHGGKFIMPHPAPIAVTSPASSSSSTTVTPAVKTPGTAKSANGLSASGAANDMDSPTSPKTPSKASGKKGKKRK